MKNSLLYCIRLALGVIFVWSGLTKLRQPYEFLSAVYAYQLVGPTMGVLIAACLPWLELVFGAALLAGVFVDGAGMGIVLLSGLFAIAVTSAWLRSLQITCGCFGASSQTTIGILTVVESLGLLVLSLIPVLAGPRKPRSQSIRPQPDRVDASFPNRSRDFLVPDRTASVSL